jgi:hypothetical protein
VTVATEQHAEVIEGSDNPGQLNPVDEKDRQGNLLLANGIKKKILQVLRTFRHRAASF